MGLERLHALPLLDDHEAVLAQLRLDRQAAGLDETQCVRFYEDIAINRAIRAAWQNNPSLNPSP